MQFLQALEDIFWIDDINVRVNGQTLEDWFKSLLAEWFEG